ncbi:MAG: hypothetical protein GY719_28875 [bacterium]|nr:hypothetical protein [bacterium]
MRNSHKLPLAAALLAVGGPLPAQDLRLDHLEHLSLEDGLAHSTVWDVQQDRLGFLWFATSNFLQRYDGYRFEGYKEDPDDPGSISSGEVVEIYEDRQGVLWFATRSAGLNRLDRAQERFVRYRHDPADPRSLASDALQAIHQDRAGNLWVGTQAGLHRLDRETGGFVRYQHDPADAESLSHDWVWVILEDRDGDLWVGTFGGGINRLDAASRGTGAFVHYRHDPADPASLSHDAVFDLHEDRSGALWAATADGLNRFVRPTSRRAREAFVRYPHDPADPGSVGGGQLMAIHEDREGELWIASQSTGLSRLDRTGNERSARFVRYRHDPRDPYGLSSDALLNLHEDRSGILWIATRGGGVDKFDRRRERFTTYRPRPAGDGGLTGDRVWAVTEDRAGGLWAGTFDGGLSALERGSAARAGAGRERAAAGDLPSLPDDSVTSILEDGRGELWTGTYGGGLVRFGVAPARHSVRYRHDPRDARSLGSDYVRCLLADRSGRLWVGLRKAALQRLVRHPGGRQKDYFITYRHDPEDPRSLSSGYIYDLFEDRSGELWLGTSTGLDRFEAGAGVFAHHRHQPGHRDSLSSDVVTSIYEDAAGIFWIGTSAGLNRWDRAAGGEEGFRCPEDGARRD